MKHLIPPAGLLMLFALAIGLDYGTGSIARMRSETSGSEYLLWSLVIFHLAFAMGLVVLIWIMSVYKSSVFSGGFFLIVGAFVTLYGSPFYVFMPGLFGLKLSLGLDSYFVKTGAFAVVIGVFYLAKLLFWREKIANLPK